MILPLPEKRPGCSSQAFNRRPGVHGIPAKRFTDDSGKNRLCYSVDIIKGRKIYSMFITTGEYHAKDGSFLDKKTNELINLAASSFGLENTPESEKRRLEGESRNRKLVFAENYLKRLIDPKLKITSVGKIQPDGSTTVIAGNTADSGYYRTHARLPGKACGSA
jgi:hypothetical protein